jgi:enamine deaminase RidA (YjgF/YER057c/UK114 family)
MGTYVDELNIPVPAIEPTNVDPSSAGYVGGENIILQQFNGVTLLVDEMKELIIGYMENLNDLLSTVVLPDGWDEALADITIAPIPEIDLSGIPTPRLPVDTAAMWEAIFAKIQADLASGGSGLGAVVEAALYQRDADRRQAANEEAYSLAISEISSKALSFPQYAKQSLENQMAAKILEQQTAASNEILISQAELAQKNTQFILEKGGGLLAEIAKTEAAVYESTVRAMTEWYRAVAENNKAQIARAELELRKVVERLKAELDSNTSIVTIRERIIDGMMNASAQVMASALNAMNISVGATVTSSKSIGETWSHSEGTSVNHHQSLSDSHNTSHQE